MTVDLVWLLPIYSWSDPSGNDSCNAADLELMWTVNSYILLGFGLLVGAENAAFVAVYATHRELRVLPNAYVVSLNVADLLYAACGVTSVGLLGSPQVRTSRVRHNTSVSVCGVTRARGDGIAQSS